MPKKATIRTRQRGKTFSYSFDAGKHPVTGRRKVIEKGGFETAQEAYDAGVAAYTNWKSGNIGLTSEKVLLKDYLHMWLENVARPQVKLSTYENYLYLITKNIIPYLGEIPLQDLRPRNCAFLMKKLYERGLVRRTIIATRNALSTALKYAVYPAELIPSNVASGFPVPRSSGTRVPIKRTLVTPEMLETIFQKHPFGGKFYIPILIAYHTGMRAAEVLGLEWTSVDFQTGTIKVYQNQCFSRELRRSYLDTPKTEQSARVVLIDKLLLDELKRWRAQQQKNRDVLKDQYQIVFTDADGFLATAAPALLPREAVTHDFICTDRRGRIIRYDLLNGFLSRNFGLNTHSFRHTHATQLIEAGAKPVSVAARLGHKDATITQNLYTHDTEVMQRETLSIFENALPTLSHVDKIQRRQIVDKQE